MWSRTETNAATLACRLHAGQVDKVGQPYLDHLTAVVTILRERWPDVPEWAVEAAWLHDALEDTDAWDTDLMRAGVSDEAMARIRRLTRRSDMTYAGWIDHLAASNDLWAVRIKLADNAHNSAEGRAIPSMAQRYAEARAVLEAAERELRETQAV